MLRRGSNKRKKDKRKRKRRDLKQEMAKLQKENAQLREALIEELAKNESSEEVSGPDLAVSMIQTIFPKEEAPIDVFAKDLITELRMFPDGIYLAKQMTLDSSDAAQLVVFSVECSRFRLFLFKVSRDAHNFLWRFLDYNSDEISFEKAVGSIMRFNNFRFTNLAVTDLEAKALELTFRSFFFGVIRTFGNLYAYAAHEHDPSYISLEVLLQCWPAYI